uniref:Uncharacterized protein n=1 Tax=Arundo donax TaxID=35708 RepID=A0A0A9ASA9_ARUDO
MKCRAMPCLNGCHATAHGVTKWSSFEKKLGKCLLIKFCLKMV